jgi:hypothetical protein
VFIDLEGLRSGTGAAGSGEGEIGVLRRDETDHDGAGEQKSRAEAGEEPFSSHRLSGYQFPPSEPGWRKVDKRVIESGVRVSDTLAEAKKEEP